jgi:hypothetical protein
MTSRALRTVEFLTRIIRVCRESIEQQKSCESGGAKQTLSQISVHPHRFLHWYSRLDILDSLL